MFKTPLSLLILVVSASQSPAHAQGANHPSPRCPGRTTVEQRDCAGIVLHKSDLKLQTIVTGDLFHQWQAIRSRLCDKAYGHLEGSIWPQIETLCESNLNQALMNNLQMKLGD